MAPGDQISVQCSNQVDDAHITDFIEGSYDEHLFFSVRKTSGGDVQKTFYWSPLAYQKIHGCKIQCEGAIDAWVQKYNAQLESGNSTKVDKSNFLPQTLKQNMWAPSDQTEAI